MELIERYIHEVGRHLPRRQRADVQAELRSLLQDMVEDQAQTKVEKADEAVVVGVLQEFGHPQRVAASYQSRPQYLIGPNLFPVFKLVLTIVSVALCVVILAGIMLSARNSDAFLADVARALVQAIPDVLQSLFSAFGSIVLVFIILERLIPEEEFAQKEAQVWDPRDLPAVDSVQAIDRGDLVAGMVFGLIFLMVLNVFPQWAGIIVIHNQEINTVPLLSQNFYANLLPWVNLLVLVSLAVDLYKLRLRWHTRTSRLLDIAVTLFTAVVLYMVITNGPVFGLNRALAQTTSFPQEGIDVFARIFNVVESIAFPLLLLAQLFSAGKQAVALWRASPPEEAPPLVGKAR